MAEAFIPIPDGYTRQEVEVDHVDGNKLNNDLSNLEWVTHRENTMRAFTRGPYSGGWHVDNKGENHCFAKLKDQDVLEIRELWKSGVKGNFLMKKFNVCRATISMIVNRRIWIHI